MEKVRTIEISKRQAQSKYFAANVNQIVAEHMHRKPRPGFSVTMLAGVRRSVWNYMCDAAHALQDATEIRHVLPVFLTPTACLTDTDGFHPCGFGAFTVVKRRPAIVIAANIHATARLAGEPVEQLTGDLIPILAHELVHYEQWRDGRAGQERGVEQRVRGLLKKAFGNKIPELVL